MTLLLEHRSLQSAAAALRSGQWLMLASPHRFYRLAGSAAPFFVALALLFAGAAMGIESLAGAGSLRAGHLSPIVFIHEPAAWMSLWILTVMAFWGAVWLTFRLRLSRMLFGALAPTGVLFTFLALWSGSLWGKPTWGQWWLWDARLTSELVLLLLYGVIIGLQAFVFDSTRGDDLASGIALAGAITVPIVYSAVFWATADGRGFVGLTGVPTLASSTLAAAVLMTLAFWMYAFATSLTRVRSIILELERDAAWVAEATGQKR